MNLGGGSPAAPEKRPVRQLRAVLLALLVVLAVATAGIGLLKRQVDRRVDARVRDEAIRRVRERLELGQAQVADDTLLFMAQARPAFREQLAWTFMDYAPALPRFTRALLSRPEALGASAALLRLELTLRAAGPDAAMRLADNGTPRTARLAAFQHLLATQWAAGPLAGAPSVPVPVPAVPGTSLADGALDYLEAIGREAQRRDLPPDHRARRAFHLGDHDAARALLLEAWAGSPLPDTAYLLGQLAEAGGRPADARRWYAEAVRLGPHRAAAQALVALAGDGAS
jgi:tetratricopeptide (TPR) repeat protein